VKVNPSQILHYLLLLAIVFAADVRLLFIKAPVILLPEAYLQNFLWF